jgi:hypothetical protein
MLNIAPGIPNIITIVKNPIFEPAHTIGTIINGSAKKK